jgi:hypothetical protein
MSVTSDKPGRAALHLARGGRPMLPTDPFGGGTGTVLDLSTPHVQVLVRDDDPARW